MAAGHVTDGTVAVAPSKQRQVWQLRWGYRGVHFGLPVYRLENTFVKGLWQTGASPILPSMNWFNFL